MPVSAWAVTRAALLLTLFGAVRFPGADVRPDVVVIYHGWYERLLTGSFPVHDVTWQYPPAAAAVFLAPALLPFLTYSHAFYLLACAADATVLAMLLRAGRVHGRDLASAWLWVAGVTVLGPLALARYDVMVTALAVAALPAAARRPGWRARWPGSARWSRSGRYSSSPVRGRAARPAAPGERRWSPPPVSAPRSWRSPGDRSRSSPSSVNAASRSSRWAPCRFTSCACSACGTAPPGCTTGRSSSSARTCPPRPGSHWPARCWPSAGWSGGGYAPARSATSCSTTRRSPRCWSSSPPAG
ncbi:glycosyltransferase 87 family protein [Streptomyces lasalocidi]